MKRDIFSCIKMCHVCQLTAKPNQTLKPFPLSPISVVSEPFEHLIIDCVGPLPKSKSGSCYLLTVMCQSTSYPTAYPLHTITAKSVVRALLQFISVFGIPKIIQSDRGTNFTSHLFAQVLKKLKVKHNQATAYYTESFRAFPPDVKVTSACVLYGAWKRLRRGFALVNAGRQTGNTRKHRV